MQTEVNFLKSLLTKIATSKLNVRRRRAKHRSGNYRIAAGNMVSPWFLALVCCFYMLGSSGMVGGR